jgi:hypothetical protein
MVLTAAVAELGQGVRRERGCAVGVTLQMSEVRTSEGDRRRDIRQSAPASSGRRLKRLIDGIHAVREGPLGGIQRRPGPFRIPA